MALFPKRDLVDACSAAGYEEAITESDIDDAIGCKKQGEFLLTDPRDLSLDEKGRVVHSVLTSLHYQMFKIFNDPIHGTIELHPLLVKIVQTRAFDRLKYIKQLGGVHYVYPGATHTRFEHSIGTCYIAGEFARMLQRKQPELKITDKEVLCVEIAGLCHDLGHGPYSHLFEDVVKDGQLLDNGKWRHEEVSTKVFEHCIYKHEEWGCPEEFKAYGFNDGDVDFIKQLIDHDLKKLDKPKRRFLYEIVANKATGIDVDKWDYFARDCHYLGIPNEFQWRRMMALSRVVKVNDEYRLCYRDKQMNNIYGMFRTRSSLWQKAYQHKTWVAIEHMMTKALIVQKGVPLICPLGSSKLESIKTIAQNVMDNKFDGFLALTDSILQPIPAVAMAMTSVEHKASLEKAQKVFSDIASRKLYHRVYIEPVPDWRKLGPKEAKIFEKEITEAMEKEMEKKIQFFIKVVIISNGSEKPTNEMTAGTKQGKDKDDPVQNVPFFDVKKPWKKRDDEVKGSMTSLCVPKDFIVKEIWIYSELEKDKNEVVKAYPKAMKDMESTYVK